MRREALHPDSLEFAVFEKVRKIGIDRTHGQSIWHEGRRYELTANTLSTIKTMHVVMEYSDAETPEVGHQRAMVIVSVFDHGFPGGPQGLEPVLPALIHGAQLGAHPVHQLSFYVLPHVNVPACFAVPLDEQDAPASNPDA